VIRNNLLFTVFTGIFRNSLVLEAFSPLDGGAVCPSTVKRAACPSTLSGNFAFKLTDCIWPQQIEGAIQLFIYFSIY